MGKRTARLYRISIDKYRRNDGNRKSPSHRYHSNTFYRQELSIDAKIRGQKNNNCDICIISKYLSLRYLLVTNGKIQRTANIHLSHMIKVNINNKTYAHQIFSDMIHWEGHSIISIVSVLKLHLIMGRYQISPIKSHNNSKMVGSGIIDKEQLKNCHRSREKMDKKMCNPGLHPKEKKNSKKTCEIQRLVNRLISILISWLWLLY